MYTHTHTQVIDMHVYTYTYLHTHTQVIELAMDYTITEYKIGTYVHACTHIHIPAYTHKLSICMYTHTHTCIHTHRLSSSPWMIQYMNTK